MSTATSGPVRGGAVMLLVAMGVLWGLQFAMLKLAAEGGHSEINLLMLTLILLSLAFTAILLVRNQAFWPNRECLLFLAVTSLLGYVAPLIAALRAAPHISAGLLTLIASIAPVVTVLAALLLRTETVSLRRVAAVLLGCLAVGLVLWPEADLPDQGAAAWILIALVVPLCYGVESVYIAARWPKGLTTLQAVTGETLLATVMVLPIFAFYGDPLPSSLSWTGAEFAIAVFVLAGLIESLIYFHLIRTTGGVFVSFGTFISLFAGIAWGTIIFAESHGAAVWAAVAALCLSLALVFWERPAAIGKAAN